MATRAATFLYFGYGSNLYSKRIRMGNPSAVAKAWGLLKGYKLEFTLPSRRWKGAVANIVPDDNSRVCGVIWELSTEDLPSLDRQEGVHQGLYERFEISVETKDGSWLPCLTYRLTAQTRQAGVEELGTEQKPSPFYKDVMLNGARENHLPDDYVNFIETIVDNGYTGEIDLQIENVKPTGAKGSE